MMIYDIIFPALMLVDVNQSMNHISPQTFLAYSYSCTRTVLAEVEHGKLLPLRRAYNKSCF